MGSSDHDQPPVAPRSAGRVLALAIAGLVVLAAAVTAVVLVVRPSDGPGVSLAHPSRAPDPAQFTGDLRQLLLARPATAQAANDPISSDGVLSLDQAALITHPEDESKAQLQAFGYQRGAVVQWRDGEAEVLVRLFQFASPASALGYQDALDGTFAPGYFDQQQAPAQLVGGHIYVSQRPLDGRGILASATAAQGSILMIVTRYQPTSAAGPIADIATRQYANLPS
jgi:hypothetical protein